MIEWLHGFDQHAPGLDTVLASDVAQALHGLAHRWRCPAPRRRYRSCAAGWRPAAWPPPDTPA
ncbi:hypothetical protein, partial [Bordetella pertussis]|uniref:hypothetical protein n=1 Tax=Bordetella pertussis TaxID=520 RepID=UPI0021CB033B